LANLDAYPLAELVRARARIAEQGLPVYDFGLGDPEEPTPLFVRQACQASIGPASSYPTVRGSAPLRAAIADYLQRRYGADLDPERAVLPTSGSKEAVFHLPQAVIDPGAPDRAVVFPDPSYPAYERGALFAGGEPVAVPLPQDWQFRPWELDEALLDRTRLIYLNSPHNPSGAVSSLQDLARIHALCRSRNILVVCDECYADCYDRTPPPSMLEVASQGVLVLHSLSKRSGMTGYRSGFLAGDEAWIALLAEHRTNPGLAPQDFVNEAARAAWSDDEHVRERRAIFAAKRQLLEGFLRQQGLQVAPSQTTFYLWFKAPPGHDDESYAAWLRQAGIIVAPGRMLGSTSACHGYLRMAMVPSLERCAQAIEAWKALANRPA